MLRTRTHGPTDVTQLVRHTTAPSPCAVRVAAWTNGQIYPPWDTCNPVNHTVAAVSTASEPIIRGGGACAIPEEQLLFATLFWNLFFMGCCLASVWLVRMRAAHDCTCPRSVDALWRTCTCMCES